MRYSNSDVFTFTMEQEKPAHFINEAFRNYAVISAFMVLLGLLSYGVYSLPIFYQGNAKLLFKSEQQAKSQLELISSNILLERLVVKLNINNWVDADKLTLNTTPFDGVLASLGLKHDIARLEKKQKLVELLKNGISYKIMTNAPLINISFDSKSPTLAMQMPNLIANEYLNMIKSFDFIQARQVQSASNTTLKNYRISSELGFGLVLSAIVSGILGFSICFQGAVKEHLATRKSRRAASIEVPKASTMFVNMGSDDFCLTNENGVAKFQTPISSHQAVTRTPLSHAT